MEFAGLLEQNLGLVLGKGGKAWAVTVKNPIGLVVISPMGRYMEPHVVWMPEATPRTILQASLYFLGEMKKETPFLITAREADRTFFDHLCKYALMRTVGKLRDHFGHDEHAILYQSAR